MVQAVPPVAGSDGNLSGCRAWEAKDKKWVWARPVVTLMGECEEE